MSLLDHYYKLSNDDPRERITAAEALISALQAADCEEDWNYAFKRLLRGLSASQGSARLGFSMALTELIELRVDKINVAEYLALCDKCFSITGSMKGHEERGILFGRLFALQILGKSSIWDGKRASSEDLVRFCSATIDLSLQKAWLREPPFFALCELMQRVAKIPEYEKAVAKVFELVDEKGIAHTCEGVSLALAVPRFQRKLGWPHGNPMHRDNLELLCRVLREMPVSSGDVSAAKPYVHFVWTYLLNEFAQQQDSSGDSDKKKSKKRKIQASGGDNFSIEEFWPVAVDRDLFDTENSNERKVWGFAVFLLWVSSDLPTVMPLFSPNFIRVLGLQLAQKDRNLHKAAKLVLAEIVKLPKTRASELVQVVSQFMKYSPNFDKVSKTRLISDLLAAVTEESAVSQLVQLLLEYVQDASSSELLRKQWIFDNLAQLIRSFSRTNTSGASPWITGVFEALIPLAYFVNPKDDDDKETQEKLAKVAQEKIMSILSSNLGRKASPAADPQSSWPFIVFQLLLNYKQTHSEFEPRVEFDEETAGAEAKAEHLLIKIHKKRNSSRHVDSPELQAFELLFAMVLLQVYASVPDAVTMLDELQRCYRQVAQKRRTHDEEDDNGASEDNALTLTEILISLISQQSTILRKLSEAVWRTFCYQMTEKSLQLLTDILPVQESARGQQSLFDVNIDVEEEEEEEEENEEEIEMDDTKEVHEESDNESEVSESESSDAVGSDYEMDDATKARLAGALGVEHLDDEGEDEDDESSMDDEQMSALDVHLATIFRERNKQKTAMKEKRQENARARQFMVSLKGRALDLVEIYLVENPSSLLGLQFILPLLQLLLETKEPRLGERARELLRTRLCRKTQYVLQSQEDVDMCFAKMHEVHKIAAKPKASKSLGQACNQTSTFLAKLVLVYDPGHVVQITDLYQQSMREWFANSRNGTLATMFIDLVNCMDTLRTRSSPY